MILSATDRAFLRGQFAGLGRLTDAQLERWFLRTHYGDNPAYTLTTDESNDQ